MKSRLPTILLLLAGMAIAATTFYFTLVFMLGNTESVLLPDVVGGDGNAALESLSKLGVPARLLEEQFSDLYPAGVVMQQKPQAGRQIKRGRAVMLTISKGAQQVGMVRLLGLDEAQLANVLESNGLKLGRRLQGCGEMRLGRILAQFPEPEAKMGSDQAVDVVVSQGPCRNHWIVGDLRAIPLNEILPELQLAQIAYLRSEDQDRHLRLGEELRVLSQSPPPGAWVLSRGAVSDFAFAEPFTVLQLITPQGSAEEGPMRLYWVQQQLPFGFWRGAIQLRAYLPNMTVVDIDIKAAAGKNIAMVLPSLKGATPQWIYLDEER